MSYNNNPYGGNYGGGGGGGGFMANGSQGDDGAPKQRNQNLRPVTLAQIMAAEQEHPDAPLTLDGQELDQVTFVACVRGINEGSTNTSVAVEDGTGGMDIKLWREADSEDTAAELQVGTYVRILGSIKLFQNKRSVNAASIRPIASSNEWIYHRLECIHAHLQATRGSAGGAQGNAGASRSRSGVAAKSVGNYGSLTDNAHISVLDALRRLGPENPDGVHVKQLAKASGQSLNKVMEATDQLITDGLAYTTGEEERFLAMD